MSGNDLNHHNDATGLVRSASDATGTRPYLGDVNDIDQMLRQFVEGVTSRFAMVGRREMGMNEAALTDKAECLRLAAIFDGQDIEYATIEHWNGEGLANYIRNRMAETVQPSEDDEEIIAQAFAAFVHRIYGAINEAGDSADPSSLIGALQDNIRSFTWLLVGLESNE